MSVRDREPESGQSFPASPLHPVSPPQKPLTSRHTPAAVAGLAFLAGAFLAFSVLTLNWLPSLLEPGLLLAVLLRFGLPGGAGMLLGAATILLAFGPSRWLGLATPTAELAWLEQIVIPGLAALASFGVARALNPRAPGLLESHRVVQRLVAAAVGALAAALCYALLTPSPPGLAIFLRFLSSLLALWFMAQAWLEDPTDDPHQVSPLEQAAPIAIMMAILGAILFPSYFDRPLFTHADGLSTLPLLWAGARLHRRQAMLLPTITFVAAHLSFAFHLGRFSLHANTFGGIPAETWGLVAVAAILVAFLNAFTTSSKRSERAILQQNARLMATFDTAAVGIFELDDRNHFVRCNAVFCRLVGLDEATLLTLSEPVISHSHDVAQTLQGLSDLREMRIDHFSQEKRYQHASGEEIWTELHLSRGDRVDGYQPVVGCVINIAARRQMQAELTQQSARFQETVELAAVGIAHVNLEGRILWTNNRFCQQLGYTPDALLGLRFPEFTHPEDLETDLGLLQKVLSGQLEVIDREKRYVRADGTIMWGHLTAALVKDERGRPHHLISVVEDISPRKRAEEQRQEAEQTALTLEQRLRTMLENITLYAVILDTSGEIRFCNDHLLQCTGFTRVELVGANWFECLAPHDQELRPYFEALLDQSALPSQHENTIQTKDGRLRQVKWSNTLLKDSNGVVLGTASIGEDITEHRRSAYLLRSIAEKVSAKTGEDYFQSLVRFVAEHLEVAYAFVGELTDDRKGIRVTALSAQGVIRSGYAYVLEGAPCENVVGRDPCYYPSDLQTLFPRDEGLVRMGAVSYAGIPLRGTKGEPLGLIAILDKQTLPSGQEERERILSFLQIFAARASAEVERRHVHARLEEALAQQEALLNTIPDLLFELDDETRLVNWRAPSDKSLFVPPEVFRNRRVEEFLPSSASQVIQAALDRARETGSDYGTQYQLPIGGEVRWYELSVARRSSPSPSRAGFVTMVRDVSSRKQVEEELQAIKANLERLVADRTVALTQRENSLRAIVGSVADAILTLDAELYVRSLNPAGEVLFGYRAEEVLGKSVDTLMQGGLRGALRPWSYADEEGEGRQLKRVLTLTGLERRGGSFPLEVVLTAYEREGQPVYIAVCRDLTEQQKAEKVLRDTVERYKALFDGSPDGIVMAEVVSGELRYANAAAASLFRYSPGQLLSLRFTDLHPPSVIERAREGFILASQNKLRIVEDILCQRSDGTLFSADIGVGPLELQGHQYLVGTFRDISTQQRTAQELRQEMELAQSIVNSLPGLFYLLDEKGDFQRWNLRCESLLNRRREEIAGLNVLEVFKPSMQPQVARALQQALTVGYAELETEGTEGDEPPHPWLCTARRVELNGTPHLVGVGLDTYVLNQAQEQARLLSQVVEQVPVSLMIMLPSGEVEYVNPSFLEATGFSPLEVRSSDAHFLLGCQHDPVGVKEAWAALERGEQWQGELCSARQDGTPLWEQVTLSVLRDQRGMVSRYVAVRADISKKKLAELELQMARDAALEANDAKSTFVAHVGHDLRQHLNVILNYSQLVAMETLTEMQAEHLTQISGAGRAIQRYTEDLLQFVKLETGKATLRQAEFDLDLVLEQSINLVSHMAEEKGLTLILERDPRVPPYLLGDAQSLDRVLANLLSNAVKFTSRGYVAIRLSLEAREEHRVHLLFAVEDTGIGMDGNLLPQLFQPFGQTGTDTMQRIPGIGLGLAISRQLVELMGGRIWVQSAKGEGTTFAFSLPLDRPQDERRQQRLLPERVRGKRLLFLEPDPHTRRALQGLLSSAGMLVMWAERWEECLVQLEKASPPIQVDLMLAAWQETGLSSPGAVEGLRQALGSSVPLLIIATPRQASQLSGLRQRGLIQGTLRRPVGAANLMDAILEALGMEKRRHPPGWLDVSQLELPLRQLRGSRLLVVDDETLNRSVAQEHLTRLDIRTELAQNGREAVNLLQQEENLERFQGVLMDLQMPELSGLEATRILRQDKRFYELPIIAMTADTRPETRKACLEAGFTDFLPKPLEQGQLFQALLRHVRPPRPQVEGPDPSEPSALIPPLPPERSASHRPGPPPSEQGCAQPAAGLEHPLASGAIAGEAPPAEASSPVEEARVTASAGLEPRGPLPAQGNPLPPDLREYLSTFLRLLEEADLDARAQLGPLCARLQAENRGDAARCLQQTVSSYAFEGAQDCIRRLLDYPVPEDTR